MSEIPPFSVPAARAGVPGQVRSAASERVPTAPLYARPRQVALRQRDVAVLVAGRSSVGSDATGPPPGRIVAPPTDAGVSKAGQRSAVDRSMLVLPLQSVSPNDSIDRQPDAPWRERKPSFEEAIRNRPEVRPYLRGGKAFQALSRKFELARETAQQRFEIRLIGLFAAEPSSISPERADRLAKKAAGECVEFVVRRAEGPLPGYPALIDTLSANPGAVKRFGCFETKGIFSGQVFTSFNKTGANGVPLHRMRNRLVHSERNKVHLNVNKEDVPEAWQAVQPLLFSMDNPFVCWKATNIGNAVLRFQGRLDRIAERRLAGEPGLDADGERADARSRLTRITEGMQFTLYPIVSAEDANFRLQGPLFRHFLTLVDWALAERGIRPGIGPESDVAIQGLGFSTYRYSESGSWRRAVTRAIPPPSIPPCKPRS